MNETLNLIDDFWNEVERLQKHHLVDQHGEFCQCGTEKFIKRCKNPIKMRSFLMVGILIDQCIDNQVHDEFKHVFKYPGLHGHPFPDQHPSSWFADNFAMRDPVDWRSVNNIFDILINDTKSWLVKNYGAESIYNLKTALIYNIDRSFEKYPGGILLNHLVENSFLSNA
jgi:hypothetical protein